MRKLFVIVLLLISLSAFSQATVKGKRIFYCVQVCSTQNPNLLAAKMFAILDDVPMIEYAKVGERTVARILFVYDTKEEQEIAHTSWLKQWHDAFMITKNEDQVIDMSPLFLRAPMED